MRLFGMLSSRKEIIRMRHRNAGLKKGYYRDKAPGCQGEGNIRMKHRDAGVELEYFQDEAPGCRVEERIFSG